jgi:DNA-binding phage protein
MSKTVSQSTYKASVDYHSSHIAHLQDPEYAAVYLDVHLEDHEPSDIEANLLKLALSNVAEALAPEQLEACNAALEAIMQKKGVETIYGLATWLKGLGLKLTVTVDAAEAQSQSPDQELEDLEIAA